jgi:hypothetical protein
MRGARLVRQRQQLLRLRLKSLRRSPLPVLGLPILSPPGLRQKSQPNQRHATQPTPS